MSYSVYQSLLDQAAVEGWFGVGMMALAAALAFGLAPWLFRRAKRVRTVGLGDGGSQDAGAMIVVIASLVLFCWGASQAKWLLNPRGYVIEHVQR
jgi:hypothetical protein